MTRTVEIIDCIQHLFPRQRVYVVIESLVFFKPHAENGCRWRALDEAHQQFLDDQVTDIEEAHNKGKAEGQKEGEAIGTARGKSPEA